MTRTYAREERTFGKMQPRQGSASIVLLESRGYADAGLGGARRTMRRRSPSSSPTPSRDSVVADRGRGRPGWDAAHRWRDDSHVSAQPLLTFTDLHKPSLPLSTTPSLPFSPSLLS